MEICDDPKIFKYFKSLSYDIMNFEILWHNFLVRRVSKILQSDNMPIGVIINHLKALISFLKHI